MKNKLFLLVFILVSTLTSPLFSQNEFTFVRSDNAAIKKITTKVEKEGWLTFKKSARVKPKDLFTTHKSSMGLDVNDEMREYRQFTDAQGMTVIKTRQHFKGIPVMGTDFFLHSKNDNLELAHGKLVEKLNINIDQRITESEALNRALSAINATKYAWQDSLLEQGIKQDLKNPSATNYPKSSLIIVPKNEKNYRANNYILCYVFEIKSISPQKHVYAYVDAKNGKVEKVLNASVCNKHDEKPNNILNCRSRTGTCTTKFNGNQNFTTENRWLAGDFILEDCTRGELLHTKIHKGTDSFWWSDQVTDGDNSWGNDDQTATSGHWALQKSWDYFNDKFNRNGMDNNGAKVRLFVDFDFGEATVGSFNIDNGYNLIKTGFNPDAIGSAPAGSISWVTLDNIGHEFTHGIIRSETSLGPGGGTGEFGALNESFADIFGEMIERHVTGSTDMINGAQIQGLRNLANPALSLTPQPITYEGTNWNFNFLGSHKNNGVQNRWFSILSTQGAINVQPIGFDKAAQITFRTLTHHLTSGSQYADIRLGSIQAAIDLFGPCSNEVRQTKNAWATVGLGSFDNLICLSVYSSGYLCVDENGNLLASISASSDPANATITWNIPSGMMASANGNLLTITGVSNPGIYIIGATASLPSFSSPTIETYVLFENCNVQCPGCPIYRQNNAGNNSKGLFSVYPNPSSSKISINLDSNWQQGEIHLYDIAGKELKRFDISEVNKFEIDVSDIPNGVYFLQGITNGVSQLEKIQIIKQ